MPRETWWRGSDNLRRPYHARGWFTQPLCHPGELESLLRAAAHRDVRAYIECAARRDHEAQVLRDPPRAGEPLEAWADRIFGGRQFGLLVSGAEGGSEPLARRVATFLDPIVTQQGVPYGGVDVAFFLGNRGFAPFGVHHHAKKHLIHCHLGPGAKTVAVWSPESYRAQRGASVDLYQPELVFDGGDQHELAPGDLFFVPAGYYATGRLSGYSIGITISLVTCTNRELIDAAVQDEIDRAIADTPARRMPWRRSAHVPGSTDLIDDVLHQIEGRSLPPHTWLRRCIEQYRLANLSNHGLKLAPPRGTVDLAAVTGGTLRRVSPFRIYTHRHDARRIALFVRRHRFLLPAAPAPQRLIARLNRDEPLRRAEVAAELGARSALRLMAALVELGGAELVDEEAGQ